MPGIITRDGVIIDAPVLDEQARSCALDAMVAAFLELRPDAIREAVEKYQKEAGAAC